MLSFRGFAGMEWTLGPGGQLHSFEAVFSPRGPDGKPRLAWDRRTGKIHAAVIESWKRYDIRLKIESNWPHLEQRLKGKLHVFMGGADTFYLDGATRLLQASLRKLSDDPVVEIHPGKTHFNLLTRQLQTRIYKEMVTSFQQGAARSKSAVR